MKNIPTWQERTNVRVPDGASFREIVIHGAMEDEIVELRVEVVRVCNTHDELVRALEMALSILEPTGRVPLRVYKALAAAKGE